MKTTTRNILLALSLLGSAAGVASAQASFSAGIQVGSSGRASVDLGFFYDNLASYGNWIQRPSYGWVWTPNQVSADWRPYQDGHWVWTDEGWTWISDEPYGWATYHYGRWYDDPEVGWSWVPGNEWAPAWVDWQEGENYVGWAPLPPSYDINVGYGGGYRLAPEAYVFVPERNFLSVSIGAYIVPRLQVTSFFGRTRNYTSYRHEGDRIYNVGVPIERIQRVVGRQVPRYQIADLQGGYQGRGARIQGNRVEIFRPQVQRTQVAPPASRPAARRAVVSAEQFQASHPNRAAQRQQGQGQAARQRQYNGQQPQDQNQNGRQRQYNGQQQVQPDQRQQDRASRQRQYNPQQQDQMQNDRQRQYDAQRQQQQNQANRQQQYDAQRQQQIQNDRQRQYNAQRQQQQDQASRQRQYDNQRRVQSQDQNDRQPPPQANRQYQRPPQNQPPADRNGQARAQSKDKGNQNDKAQQQRDRRSRENQNQNDDPHRPPVRRR
jgi:hypothetical protein